MPWSRAWRGACTRDISASGLSFSIPSGLCFRGQPVEVAVDIPAAAFRVNTRVARIARIDGRRDVGLRFNDLSRRLREKLRFHIRRMRYIDTRDRRVRFSF